MWVLGALPQLRPDSRPKKLPVWKFEDLDHPRHLPPRQQRRRIHLVAAVLEFAIQILIRPGARQSKFVKGGGRSKLVKGRLEIDMDEFGVDKDVIRTSSTRSIR